MLLALLMFFAVVTLYGIRRCFDRPFRKFSERGREMAMLLMLVHTNMVNVNGNTSTVFQVLSDLDFFPLGAPIHLYFVSPRSVICGNREPALADHLWQSGPSV
jgi:hypothetical protein